MIMFDYYTKLAVLFMPFAIGTIVGLFVVSGWLARKLWRANENAALTARRHEEELERLREGSRSNWDRWIGERDKAASLGRSLDKISKELNDTVAAKNLVADVAYQFQAYVNSLRKTNSTLEADIARAKAALKEALAECELLRVDRSQLEDRLSVSQGAESELRAELSRAEKDLLRASTNLGAEQHTSSRLRLELSEARGSADLVRDALVSIASADRHRPDAQGLRNDLDKLRGRNLHRELWALFVLVDETAMLSALSNAEAARQREAA